MDRNINTYITDNIFGKYSETVWVYLKKSNTKGSTYDPYRQTGYTKTNQSPIPVEAIVRQIAANSLIIRELGLSSAGAIEIIVKEVDMNAFKICEKVKYNDVQYSPYNDALGNKVQIFKRPF